MTDTNDVCSDFASVVKKYMENDLRIQTLRRELKQLRAAQTEMSTVILKYMETKKLDVCRVTSGNDSGEICTVTKKSRPNLKRDEQVAFIAAFFDDNGIEFNDGTSSTKADELYTNMNNKRQYNSSKGITLRRGR